MSQVHYQLPGLTVSSASSPHPPPTPRFQNGSSNRFAKSTVNLFVRTGPLFYGPEAPPGRGRRGLGWHSCLNENLQNRYVHSCHVEAAGFWLVGDTLASCTQVPRTRGMVKKKSHVSELPESVVLFPPVSMLTALH